MEPVDASKKHFYISMVKSVLRLGACYLLWSAGAVMGDIAGVFVQWSAFALAAAEGLGILEEL